MLPTLTRDIVDRWIEDLLNPTDASFDGKAGPRDLGMGSLISRAEVAEVVKKVLGGRALGLDEIHLEFSECCRAVVAVRTCVDSGDSAAGVAGVVVTLFKKGGPESVFKL